MEKSSEKQTQSNLYFVSYEKEVQDTLVLVNELRESNWVSSDMVIVNCYPDYSSIVSQIVNHKLSYMNRNELYEQINLEMPYPSMAQIWNRNTFEYEMYDRYLAEWVNKNVSQDMKYLFVTALMVSPAPFTKLKGLMRDKADYKIVSLYSQSSIDTDFNIKQVPAQDRILFGWQNSNNKNF